MKRIIAALVVLPMAFSSLTVTTLAQEKKNANQRERVEAYASAFLANRASFNHMVCEYEMRRLQADSESQLLTDAGVVQTVANGLLIRDGTKTRCEVNLSDEDLRSFIKAGRSPFSDDRMLLDGELGVTFSRSLSGGVLYSSKYPPEKLPRTPFDFGGFTGSEGVFTPGWILERSDLPIEATLSENVVVDNRLIAPFLEKRQLVLLDYRCSSPKNDFLLRFHIDTKHGCIPILSEFHLNGNIMERAVVTDIRQLDSGQSFPMRSLCYSLADDGKGDFKIGWVDETRVTKFVVDQPIENSIFQIEIEKLTLLRDAADDNSQFQLQDRTSLALDDIPKLLERAHEASVRQARRAEAKAKVIRTGERKFSWLWLWLLLSATMALMVVLLVRSRRNRLDH